MQERGNDIANLLEGLGAKRGLSLMFARMKKVGDLPACRADARPGQRALAAAVARVPGRFERSYDKPWPVLLCLSPAFLLFCAGQPTFNAAPGCGLSEVKACCQRARALQTVVCVQLTYGITMFKAAELVVLMIGHTRAWAALWAWWQHTAVPAAAAALRSASPRLYSLVQGSGLALS